MTIILLHAGGQSGYDSKDVLAFGSLENLIASQELADIPNREKSLTELWEVANMPEVPYNEGDYNEENDEKDL